MKQPLKRKVRLESKKMARNLVIEIIGSKGVLFFGNDLNEIAGAQTVRLPKLGQDIGQ